MGVIAKPALLNATHDLSTFDCGNETLNEWLKKKALKNQEQGASRTFVICKGHKVIGYYALASGSVERLIAPKSISRNMPEPIPVIVLARLAIDQNHQGNRLGADLLKDAMLRALRVAQNIGIRALLVHAISDPAKNFYQTYGFQESPVDPMTLFLSIKYLKAHL